MNTHMKEMDLYEMEAVTGGINWKRVFSGFDTEDALLVVLCGPFGQGLVAAKATAIIAAE